MDLFGRRDSTSLHSASTPLPSCRGPSWTARFGFAALSQHLCVIVDFGRHDSTLQTWRLGPQLKSTLLHFASTLLSSSSWAFVDDAIRHCCTSPASYVVVVVDLCGTRRLDIAALRQHLIVIAVVDLCGRRDLTPLHVVSDLATFSSSSVHDCSSPCAGFLPSVV